MDDDSVEFASKTLTGKGWYTHERSLLRWYMKITSGVQISVDKIRNG